MGILSYSSLVVLVIVSLVQGNVVSGNSISNRIPIFEDGATRAVKTKATQPPIEATKCPDASTIAPCTCYDEYQYVDTECLRSAVNQTTIENVFREIKKANGIPEDRAVGVSAFSVEETEMTQLDFAPFYGNQMRLLSIRGNDNLTKFVTSGNPEDLGSIHAASVQLAWAPLKREGFGDALKYFSNEMVYLDATVVDFSDFNNDEDGEYLPGFSALTNLEHFELLNCNVTGQLTTDSWNFKGMGKLELLSFYNNKIEGIGENVFDFAVEGNSLKIELHYSKLNETSLHPNSGIARTDRQTNLYLNYNQFTTLPSETFQPFLDAHPSNILELYGNPLICDQKLSWIKSRRAEYQNRVPYAYCENDYPHTVFDSDLIP